MTRLGDFVNIAKGERDTAEMWFIPLDPNTGRRLDRGSPNNPPPSNPLKPARLQYWPETVDWDSGDTGWSQTNVPGLSHALLNWTHGGSPTVSFDIKLTSDMDPAYKQAVGDLGGASDVVADFTQRRNIDVEAAMTYFNALQLPRYQSDSDISGKPVQPPPVIQIVPEYVPMETPLSSENQQSQDESFELGANDVGEGNFGKTASTARGFMLSNQAYRDFYAVVADISDTYESSFNSGAPRQGSVSLSLIETIQIGNQILPHDRERASKIAQSYSLSET